MLSGLAYEVDGRVKMISDLGCGVAYEELGLDILRPWI